VEILDPLDFPGRDRPPLNCKCNEENGWVVTNIYPEELDPNLGERIDNSGDLEDDDE
jgi:hypothetical protein